MLAWIVTVLSLQYLAVGASEGLGAFLPLLIAFYSVGRYADIRALVAAGPLAALGLAVHELRDPAYHFGGSTVTFWIILAAAWPLGHAFRRRQHAQEVLSDRAESLERDRERRAHAAVAAERARIARELHDVVGHAVSLIVLQAVAGLGLLDKNDTHQARTRLTTIEATARQALAEMRRLLELLDDGEDGEEMLRPTPGLGRLAGAFRSAPGVRPAGRAAGQRRPDRAAARPGPGRLPHRPGGADQHHQARRPRPGHGDRLPHG